jgi:hypothetical protein
LIAEYLEAVMLREHDPVEFRSLRSLLKTKLIRLGEFDRLIDQRRRERVESRNGIGYASINPAGTSMAQSPTKSLSWQHRVPCGRIRLVGRLLYDPA